MRRPKRARPRPRLSRRCSRASASARPFVGPVPVRCGEHDLVEPVRLSSTRPERSPPPAIGRHPRGVPPRARRDAARPRRRQINGTVPPGRLLQRRPAGSDLIHRPAASVAPAGREPLDAARPDRRTPVSGCARPPPDTARPASPCDRARAGRTGSSRLLPAVAAERGAAAACRSAAPACGRSGRRAGPGDDSGFQQRREVQFRVGRIIRLTRRTCLGLRLPGDGEQRRIDAGRGPRRRDRRCPAMALLR